MDQKVVGDPLKNRRQPPWSSKAASAARSLARQVLVKACADFFVAQRLAALDLRQAFLDLAHEPIIVINQALDRFARQCLGIGSALARDAREVGLQVRRTVSVASRYP